MSLRWMVSRLPEPVEPARGPVGLLDVELSQPVTPVPADRWASALVLVRLHGRPLGTVEVTPADGQVEPPAILHAVDDELATDVRAHLRRDGILAVDGAPPAGETRHRCLRDLDPPAPPPFVTVVVATRDRPQKLDPCLRSILGTAYPSFEVVVVDNAPSDTSTERAVGELSASDPRVRYVRVARPGASHARNVGATLGRGEIVAFTDDDAVVDRRWLAALVAGWRDDPQVACVTGLTLPIALDTPAQQAFEAYGGMGLGFRGRVYDLQEHRGDTRLYPYTAGVFGASNNAAFRREQFLERGGFDEALGPATPAFGAEDLDVFLSLILDGQRIVYQPAAIVRHEHRRDFAELYWQVFTYSAGFTALLTKWVLKDRAVARELAERVPALLPAALLRARRGDGGDECGDYPPQLRWLERAGYVYGPAAYARTRARAWWRRHRPALR
jgi:glycosyltransferase involved in cell wall biosynthesis